jgi:HD-GYP domain-containing protein (c-di-GMP phosphodiesterase class II)
MFPVPPRWRAGTPAYRRKVRAILQAVDTLGQDEQPDLYSHIHPHSHATARLTRAFASAHIYARNGNGPTLDEIELGAYLHDFGKYLIAKSILLKPGPLTEEERTAVSYHPIYGAQVLSNLPAITETVHQIVLHHHERWDGTGYPDGLHGTRIPLAARLISIVDVYTSLRARRSYKASFTRREAATTLLKMVGHELDPDMTRDFLKFIGFISE